jgi:hypothetical protein
MLNWVLYLAAGLLFSVVAWEGPCAVPVIGHVTLTSCVTVAAGLFMDALDNDLKAVSAMPILDGHIQTVGSREDKIDSYTSISSGLRTAVLALAADHLLELCAIIFKVPIGPVGKGQPRWCT